MYIFGHSIAMSFNVYFEKKLLLTMYRFRTCSAVGFMYRNSTIRFVSQFYVQINEESGHLVIVYDAFV